MNELSPIFFFNLHSFKHRELFEKERPVWRALIELKKYMRDLHLGNIECEIPSLATLVHPDLISIGKGTIVHPGAYIEGPCVIGQNCEVRHAAFVRPFVLTGNQCVIGHSTEVKHAIFLNGAKASHFNYVGDSILGANVNLGAGVKCANTRLDQKVISIRVKNTTFSSGLRKFGVILGDDSQIGCNVVLNPGLLLRKKTFIRCCESVSKSNI